MTLSAPRSAQARSGKFLETIGVSTAVGTVLGASTLPFYDQPGSHLGNLAYGAGAGLVVGTGICLYRWLSGQQKRDVFGEENPRGEKPADILYQSIARTNRPATVWTPLVSLTW